MSRSTPLRIVLLTAVMVSVAGLMPDVAVAAGGDDGHGGGVVDLLLKTLNLVVFFGLLGYLIGRPLVRYLNARADSIRNDLADAEAKLAEAERVRERLMERIQEVEQEVADLKQRAEQEGIAEAERIRAEAETEEARFLARVDAELERRTKETKRQLAEEVARLTREMTRQLLEDTITDADRKRVLSRSLAALESVQTRG
jgi:F-type H+-transporting ATPase subunit b